MNETAFAKINLSLDITGKRDNGYHELQMVMQTIALHDDVEVCKNESGDITLSVMREPFAPDGNRLPDTMPSGCIADNAVSGFETIPSDSSNLMWKAAAAMKTDYGIDCGFDMKLFKRIPSAAGLGGGSADAAAVIRAVNRLCRLSLPSGKLQETALKVGSDVPFLIDGGLSLCEGIGEIITGPSCDKKGIILNCLKRIGISSSDELPDICIILVKPFASVDTAMIYKEYDKFASLKGKPAEYMNVLEPVTSSFVPDIPEIKKALLDAGAFYAAMSGSGPTVFGLFRNNDFSENSGNAGNADLLCRKLSDMFSGKARVIKTRFQRLI